MSANILMIGTATQMESRFACHIIS